MTHPDDDVLAAMALGDPAPSEATDHVRGCASCTESLAALRATVSTLREPVDALLVPPASVWDAVTSEIDGKPDASWGSGDRGAVAPSRPARSGAHTRRRRRGRPRRPPRRPR